VIIQVAPKVLIRLHYFENMRNYILSNVNLYAMYVIRDLNHILKRKIITENTQELSHSFARYVDIPSDIKVIEQST